MKIAGTAGQRGLDARLAHVKGAVNVWVSLDQPSLAAYKAAKLAEQGIETQPRRLALAASGASLRAAEAPAETAMRSAVQSQRGTLLAQQASVLGQLKGMGAQRLGSVHVAHNAVAVKVDAASLRTIAQLPGVLAVRPVVDYKTVSTLGETASYVGAAAAQATGKDGRGVRVAVLDSGIDYTHYNLGGPGTAAAYAAAYGADPSDPKNTVIPAGLFPSTKVIGGYDFVGESWPNAGLAPDPNPIDYQGHGTHVADIIAGLSKDGKHKGIAPGASLLAVKVCSSVSTSCSGVALLEGVDYALDPNGDGNIGDAVDLINLSVGSDYGQEEEDLAQAVQNAVDLGVVVAVAAGNAANRPYIVSSPSIAPGAISVAQTAVPSDKAYPLVVNSPAAIAGSYANTGSVDWAPVGSGFSGTVAYVGRGCPSVDGSTPDTYLASPAGKVALIDRGVCSVSLKVDRAAKAGAIGVLIGLIAPGDAVEFSNGGGDKFVPTLVIQQSLSNSLKAALTANTPPKVTLSPTGLSLIGSMASTSARGPSISHSSIKPEIGAPGASISAIVGSGTGEEAFGGTSGATPVIAGAAAILVQAYPHFSPEQIKALLMNSAETQIYTNTALYPGVLAPITRIGAGELRIDRSLAVSSLVRNKASHSAALSFGFHDVPGTLLLERKLLVENFSTTDKYFSVQSSFRYANDAASKAVRLIVPSKVWVPARGKQEVTVALYIDGKRLPDWPFDYSNLGDGSVLDLPEYDGYLSFTAGSEKLSVPWQVLPRKASDMSIASNKLKAGQPVRLHNFGWGSGEFDVFSLTGTSPKADRSELPQPGDNFAFIDLRAVGVRLVDGEAPGDTLQFAVNTFKRRANPNYPAEFDIDIDVNRDGVPDFVVYNSEQGGFGASGTSLINVVNLATGKSTAYYLNDTDLQSSNAIFTLPLAALGIPASQAFDFTVNAFDNYFTGNLTDQIGPMTYTPSKPKFRASTDNAVITANGNANLGTSAVAGGAAASPDQSGLLLLYRRDTGRQADIVRLSK